MAAAMKKSSKLSKATVSKGKKKAQKDPNAPKRALSSYMYFAKDKRQDILRSNPSLKSEVTKISKMIGEVWGKLSEKDKIPYVKKAANDKQRYEKEKAAYLKTK
ncbi:HMG (high mobility group) box domain-containing protein [Cardiosporidium cionae]|uniref:HMG (High mobility group) box domain-containing protein n=1 Tax=Cardiosporidium cionae TaxID=476202 RepID=A0ABQ7JD86_9APIC|nr:HMG (high mobility group) box domain-containing protein [Cardiosporidium cionae]|eukprot:KAF8821590.1 HMG (high mobility group) box domain-containing protein [Cardiosporidium cionae]